MAKHLLRNKLLAIAITLVFCAVFSTQAFAEQSRNWNQDRRVENRQAQSRFVQSRHNEVQRGRVGNGGDRRVEVRRDGWFWGGIALSALAVGAIISSFPRQPETVYAAPAPSQWAYAQSIQINVPNLRGGYNPVVLTRCVGGYIGPQGEYYSGNPTLEQLRVLYGQ